jgi:hypothetical protein
MLHAGTSVKALEDALLFDDRYARATIGNFHCIRAIAIVNVDAHRRVRRRVLHRVVQQLPDRQADKAAIDRVLRHARIRDNLDVPVLDFGLHRCYYFADDLIHPRSLKANVDLRGVEPGHLDGVVDEVPQTVGFFIGDAQ